MLKLGPMGHKVGLGTRLFIKIITICSLAGKLKGLTVAGRSITGLLSKVEEGGPLRME
jgi:hypothetical protein